MNWLTDLPARLKPLEPRWRRACRAGSAPRACSESSRGGGQSLGSSPWEGQQGPRPSLQPSPPLTCLRAPRPGWELGSSVCKHLGQGQPSDRLSRDVTPAGSPSFPQLRPPTPAPRPSKHRPGSGFCPSDTSHKQEAAHSPQPPGGSQTPSAPRGERSGLGVGCLSTPTPSERETSPWVRVGAGPRAHRTICDM